MAIEIPDSNSGNEPDKTEHSSSLTAPSGRMWHEEKPTSVRRKRKQNIWCEAPAINTFFKPVNDVDSLSTFIDMILQESVRYTNLSARRMVSKWNRENPDRPKNGNLLMTLKCCYTRICLRKWCKRD